MNITPESIDLNQSAREENPVQYWSDLVILQADVTPEDIETLLSDPNADETYVEILRDIQNDPESKNYADEVLPFYVMFHNMTEAEKRKLYLYSEEHGNLPGVHQIDSRLTFYLQLFPNDSKWMRPASESLN
jgi:hypothetical protein